MTRFIEPYRRKRQSILTKLLLIIFLILIIILLAYQKDLILSRALLEIKKRNTQINSLNELSPSEAEHLVFLNDHQLQLQLHATPLADKIKSKEEEEKDEEDLTEINPVIAAIPRTNQQEKKKYNWNIPQDFLTSEVQPRISDIQPSKTIYFYNKMPKSAR